MRFIRSGGDGSRVAVGCAVFLLACTLFVAGVAAERTRQSEPDQADAIELADAMRERVRGSELGRLGCALEPKPSPPAPGTNLRFDCGGDATVSIGAYSSAPLAMAQSSEPSEGEEESFPRGTLTDTTCVDFEDGSGSAGCDGTRGSTYFDADGRRQADSLRLLQAAVDLETAARRTLGRPHPGRVSVPERDLAVLASLGERAEGLRDARSLRGFEIGPRGHACRLLPSDATYLVRANCPETEQRIDGSVFFYPTTTYSGDELVPVCVEQTLNDGEGFGCFVGRGRTSVNIAAYTRAAAAQRLRDLVSAVASVCRGRDCG